MNQRDGPSNGPKPQLTAAVCEALREITIVDEYGTQRLILRLIQRLIRIPRERPLKASDGLRRQARTGHADDAR